jgi:arylsulfatase A-like enzyme
MARWPRAAGAAAILLGVGAALGLTGEIAGDRSRFELDRNPLTSFARSALFGVTFADEVGYVPPSKFHEVLRPVAPPPKHRVDRAAYERLRELGKRQPNVVLVMMESTSPLHMSHTNPEAGTTPFMAELAGKSLFWPRHYAHTPKSIFAIYQVLCSTLTELHGREPTATRPRIDCRSISEILREQGYVNGMFHSGHFRYSQKDLFFGDRGYQVLHDAHSMPNADNYFEWSWGIEEAASIDAMVAWADANRESPFFITYIPVYPHHPYHTPYPVESHVKVKSDRNLENYQKAIRYIDDMMRKLIADFRERGLLENTLFVITGDHGEGFGEHPGSRAHGSRLYDEQARTFALWYAEGLFDRQAIDDRTFGHIDLVPTLLDVLGIPAETRHRGLSAFEPRRRPMVPLYTAHGIPFTGFVDGAMKYIYNGRARRSELYDLELDPGERDNLAPQFPDTVATYRQRAGELASVAKEWWNEVPDIPERTVDPEALAAGEEREWVIRPVECRYNPEQLVAEGGVLRAHSSGRAFCYSGELPAGDLVVTDFRLVGREDIAASVILALLGWINEAGERQQIAYCKLNGNLNRPATTCEPTMIPGQQRLAGGKGKLLTVIRYRTPASDPDPQRFSVDEVRVTYRLLKK